MTFIISVPLRKEDSHGAGYYGAPRGNKTHRGIDLCAAPGSEVWPIHSGVVTKIGYPYADDLEFRYVELHTGDDLFHRYFYVDPGAHVKVGDQVYQIADLTFPEKGDAIGLVQDLADRYPGITNHFHFEIKDAFGKYIDPTEFLT